MARRAHHSTNPKKRPQAPSWLAIGFVVVAIAGVAIGLAIAARGTSVVATDRNTQFPDQGEGVVSGLKSIPSSSPTPWYDTPPEGPVSFTLVAAGDVLPHGAVVSSATRSGSWDMDALWSELDPWVSGADLAICHMETPVAPPGTSASGFPVFASPPEVVPALKAQGWDGCSTASNHSVDKKFPGVGATLDAFDAVYMGSTGTARSADEAASAQMYRIRQGVRYITVANISFAYGTNGLPVPDGKPWSVNLFDANAGNAAPIIAAAQAARDAGADVVIASVHCCVEYRTEPTAAQRQVAQQIADSGLVDLYIGHHAHVPEPIEKLDGGPNGDGMWVAFGLGNYISNQGTNCCVPQTSNGVLLTATFTVDLDGKVTTGVEWTPITVDRLDHHRMHVLSEIPNGAGTLSAAEVAARYQRVLDAVGPQAPERLVPPEKLADGTYPVRRPV